MRTSTHRLTALWVVLVVLTLFSAEVLRNSGAIIGSSVLVSAVLLVTLVKARIIALDYMELRGAPWPLRVAFEAWLLLVSLAILFLYETSPAGTSPEAQTRTQSSTSLVVPGNLHVSDNTSDTLCADRPSPCTI